jgi:hypothetical protein
MIADAVAAYRKVVDINPVVAQARFELGMSVLIVFVSPKRRTRTAINPLLLLVQGTRACRLVRTNAHAHSDPSSPTHALA